MDYSYNYSNVYSDPYFTLTSFDSDITNPVYYNFNQVYRIGHIRINICPIPNIITKLEQSSLLFTESVRIQLPKLYGQKAYQHLSSYTLFQDQLIEEKSNFKKSYEAFLESARQNHNPTDSQAHQDFQVQDPYSIFKVPPQEKEPKDLDKSMEA